MPLGGNAISAILYPGGHATLVIIIFNSSGQVADDRPAFHVSFYKSIKAPRQARHNWPVQGALFEGVLPRTEELTNTNQVTCTGFSHVPSVTGIHFVILSGACVNAHAQSKDPENAGCNHAAQGSSLCRLAAPAGTIFLSPGRKAWLDMYRCLSAAGAAQYPIHLPEISYVAPFSLRDGLRLEEGFQEHPVRHE